MYSVKEYIMVKSTVSSSDIVMHIEHRVSLDLTPDDIH